MHPFHLMGIYSISLANSFPSFSLMFSHFYFSLTHTFPTNSKWFEPLNIPLINFCTFTFTSTTPHQPTVHCCKAYQASFIPSCMHMIVDQLKQRGLYQIQLHRQIFQQYITHFHSQPQHCIPSTPPIFSVSSFLIYMP